MNSIDKDLADIRRLTRIALPDSHTYLYRLGAVYGFASVSSFMAEVICYMDPRQNRTDLEAKMGGQLHTAFNQAVAGIEHSAPEAFTVGQETAQLFSSLNDERSDIIHAYLFRKYSIPTPHPLLSLDEVHRTKPSASVKPGYYDLNEHTALPV